MANIRNKRLSELLDGELRELYRNLYNLSAYRFRVVLSYTNVEYSFIPCSFSNDNIKRLETYHNEYMDKIYNVIDNKIETASIRLIDGLSNYDIYVKDIKIEYIPSFETFTIKFLGTGYVRKVHSKEFRNIL